MIMVNNNNYDNKKEEKSKQVMHNTIAHYPLINVRLPFPNRDHPSFLQFSQFMHQA